MKNHLLWLIASAIWFANVIAAFGGPVGKFPTGTWEQWSWGKATNGVVAGIWSDQNPTAPKELEIRVFVHEAFDTNGVIPTYYSEPNSNSVRMILFGESRSDVPTGRTGAGTGIFFQATNSFCGPIELRNALNQKVPLLKPEFCSVESYPESIRFVKQKTLGFTSIGGYEAAKPLVGRCLNWPVLN